MFCPSCGKQVGDGNRFCSSCGKSLTSEKETVLISFGPFGVSVCFGRPGPTKVAYKNNTRIIVTDRRIYGSDRSIFSSGFLRFEVPYKTVVSTESSNYGVQKVLWIQYREGENTKEVSILGGSIFGGPNRQNVTRAFELLQRAR